MDPKLSPERRYVAMALTGAALGISVVSVAAIASYPQAFEKGVTREKVNYFSPLEPPALAAARRILVLNSLEEPTQPSLDLLDDKDFLAWAAQRESLGAQIFIRHFFQRVTGDSRVEDGQIVTKLPGTEPDEDLFFRPGELAYWSYEVEQQMPGETPKDHTIWVWLEYEKSDDYRMRNLHRERFFAARRINGKEAIRVLDQPTLSPEIIELKVSNY